MSTQTDRSQTDRGGEAGQPGEDERYREERAAYEAELSRITSADLVLQAAVSLLNVGAHRMGLVAGPDPRDAQDAGGGGAQRDLEQVRDAIDAVRGLLPVLERSSPQELGPLRDALSHLQMAYAREAKSAGSRPAPAPTGEDGAPPAEPPRPAPGAPTSAPPAGGDSEPRPPSPGPGPAESSGRLWVPGR